MQFEEALIELRKGKKIRHSFFEEGKFLDIHNVLMDNIPGSYILCEQWSIHEEPGKTFPEVFEAFKEGKKIRRKEWMHSMYFKRDDRLITDLNHVDLLATDWIVLEK